MSSIESKLRDVQFKVAELLQQLFSSIQAVDWNSAKAQLQQVAAGRAETSLGLLVLDYFFSRRSGGGSFAISGNLFGKLLVALNGYNLLAFTLKDKPNKVWKDLAGLSLRGPDAETLGSVALGMAGASGAIGIAAGLAGPSNNILSVLSLAMTKLVIGFFVINHATNGGDAKAVVSADVAPMLEFGRHHARTGAVVLLYIVSLLWRGRERAGAPKYIVDMEKRLSDRLDQLVLVVKDQKSRIDAISPPPSSTPKKY